MKNIKSKNAKRKLAALTIVTILLSASFVGCAETSDAQSGISEFPQVGNNETSVTDPDQVQIEYYEKLIADLEAMLLNEKQENYIEIAEYKQAIANLEAKIEVLSKSEETSSPTETPSRDPGLNDQLSTAPPIVNKPNDVEDSPEGGIIYKNNTITGYNGSSPSPNIPSSINGVRVTSIGEGAFRDCDIEKIALPDGITYIDWFAFADCQKLSEIYIPASVTSIGYGAFENCPSFLVVKCEKGSYAETYARSWGMLVITE